MSASENPKNESFLVIESIPKLIWRLTIPVSIGLIFMTLYNVVDAFYAGKISTEALAALSLSNPIFIILIAFSYGFATGVTSLVGNALGSGQLNYARQLMAQAFSYGIMLSCILVVFGLFAIRPMFVWLGAEGRYLDYVLEYNSTILFFSFVFIMAQVFNSGLNAMGRTHYNRNVLIFSFFMNLVLDPWFIFGGLGLPAMGFRGIAYATILSQLFACIYLGYHLFRSDLVHRFSLKLFLPNFRDYLDLTRLGTPQVFDLMGIGLFFFIAMTFLSQFGPETIAAYGMGVWIEEVIWVPAVGLEVAILALVAQNYGAKKWGRVLETRKKGYLYASIWLSIALLVLLVTGPWLLDWFTQDPTVKQIGLSYLRVEAFVLPAYGLVVVSNAILQGLKKPKAIFYVSVTRLILLPSLLLWICSILGWGYKSLWWVSFFSNWITVIFLVLHVRTKLRFFYSASIE